MEKRYTALRFIGTLYKVLGVIAAVVTVVVILGFCATSLLGGAALGGIGRQFGMNQSGLAGVFGGVLGGLIAIFVAILYGGGAAITLYAIGEGIYLLLALEENTRTTARLLQQPGNPPPAASPVAPPPAGQ